MAEYLVRPGMQFGASAQYGPGDKVFLSPEEAQGFLDKLELVDPLASPPLGEGEWGDLAANALNALLAAGLTPDKVRAMTDEDLLAIKGVGPATLAAIRAALG